MRRPKLSKDNVIERLDDIRNGLPNSELQPDLNYRQARELAGKLNAVIWDLQGMVEWEDEGDDYGFVGLAEDKLEN